MRRFDFRKWRIISLLLDDGGAILVESVIAVTVFATIATVGFMAISVANRASGNMEREWTAEVIARNQMEHIFSLDYAEPDEGYFSTTTPTGYTATILAENLSAIGFQDDDDIQRITIVVDFDDNEVLRLQTVRSRFSTEASALNE